MPIRNTIKIPDNLHVDGFVMRLHYRRDNAAIYNKYLDDMQVGIEVFEVQVTQINKVTLKEIYPEDEDFGLTAWSFLPAEYSRAMLKFISCKIELEK